MSYTKRQLVNGALAEIGLAEYTFDMLPEQEQEALNRLDSMMYEWDMRGIRLGYPVPSSPTDSDIDVDSGVPGYAVEAIICNLAVSIAPSYGKQASMHTLSRASAAMNTVLSISARPRELRLPVMPGGAGNKNFEEPFIGGDESEELERPKPSLMFR